MDSLLRRQACRLYEIIKQGFFEKVLPDFEVFLPANVLIVRVLPFCFLGWGFSFGGQMKWC